MIPTTGTSDSAASATDTLWRLHHACGDREARASLLERYAGLVHHLARQTRRRAGRGVELEDLIGAGMLGLVRALDAFDPGRGLAFSTYAVPRIRGAMLDELRARDWMPRALRARARDIARVRGVLEQTLGRFPSATEVAAGIGVDLPAYWRLEALTATREFIDIDRPGPGLSAGLDETVASPTPESATAASESDERIDVVRSGLAALPEKDRLVLTLYYYEGLNLRQIGEVLHVSESRISQIRARAITRLRERLAHEGRPAEAS